MLAPDKSAERRDDKYPQISKSWRLLWINLNILLNYSPDISKSIYTTNVTELLKSAIRKATNKRKSLPTNGSAKKAIYIPISEAPEKWTMSIQNWKPALNRLSSSSETD